MGSHPRCIYYITTPYPTSQERSICKCRFIESIATVVEAPEKTAMPGETYSAYSGRITSHSNLDHASSGLTEILYYLMLGSICCKTIVKTGIYKQEELQPYLKRRDELSIQDCFLLWGNRMIIPNAVNFSKCCMKSQARSYVWWPSIDIDLETNL